jgi:hypothetical protein
MGLEISGHFVLSGPKAATFASCLAVVSHFMSEFFGKSPVTEYFGAEPLIELGFQTCG